MILQFILDSWEQIAGIFAALYAGWNVIGEERRNYLKRPFTNKQELSSIKKNIKVEDAEGDVAELDFKLRLKKEINNLTNDNIELAKLVTLANKKINWLEERQNRSFMALNKLMLLCEMMCDKTDICKESIEEVMEEFKLNDSD